MPVVVKAQSKSNPNDTIRQFKKATAAADVVQRAKDRRYFTKPSQVKAQKKNELRRQRKRLRSLKRMKNVQIQTNS